MRKTWIALACVSLIGCVAHEKAGDSAAATGDWRTAYNQYRIALNDTPDEKGLKEKYDNAKRQAVITSWQHAQGCEQSGDWPCALDEATFVLSIDPTHAQAQALRQRAAVQDSLAKVNMSRNAAAQGHFKDAISLLEKSRSESSDPGVAQQAQIAQTEILQYGVAEAERLRQARSYRESIELYETLIPLDGTLRDRARAVRAEAEAYITAQYEENARRGDAALAANDYAAASDGYQAALNVRPGGRAEPLLRYCQAMSRAQAAIAARDFGGAEAAARQAQSTGQDRGAAQAILDKIQVKLYSIAVRSVMIRPARIDGSAWVGNLSPPFFMISQQLLSLVTQAVDERAVNMAASLPYENRPDLRVEAVFPDGMRLTTPARNGVYALYDSDFVVASNAFDDRRIKFKVIRGQDANGEEVGETEVALRDLIDHRNLGASSPTILQLHLTAEPALGRQAGTFAGFTRLDAPPQNQAVAQTSGAPGGQQQQPPPPRQGVAQGNIRSNQDQMKAAPGKPSPAKTATATPP